MPITDMQKAAFVSIALLQCGCQPPVEARSADADLQARVARQAQTIADQQRDLQALNNQEQPAPTPQPQPAAPSPVREDWNTKRRARFSHLNDLMFCFNIYAQASGVEGGNLTYIDNDKLYVDIFNSKLSPHCGEGVRNVFGPTSYQNVLNAAKSCPGLLDMLSNIIYHHPDAPPRAWYQATILSVPFIHCTSDEAAQTNSETPQVPQSPTRPKKPDCNDFDAVVSYFRNLSISGGMDMSDPITTSAILQSARQYQVDHGCRSRALAPVTTNCTPGAFHDGSFSCTTQ